MLEPSRRLVLADDDAVPAAGAFVVVAATAFANGGYFPTEWGWTLLALALAGNHPETVSLSGFAWNLGWVTLGNAIGGAVFVGGAYHVSSYGFQAGIGAATVVAPQVGDD